MHNLVTLLLKWNLCISNFKWGGQDERSFSQALRLFSSLKKQHLIKHLYSEHSSASK